MNLNRKALAVAACVIVAGLGGSNWASASTQTVSEVAPPPARVENVPPKAGYIWAAGHWEWNGHSWAWITGSYIFERRGQHWTPDRWEESGSQWHFVEGRWDH
jgi:hypothetical protein